MKARVRAIPSPPEPSHHQDRNESQSIYQQPNNAEPDAFEDTIDQCAAELHEYIQLLNELHPSIEAWVPLREQSPEPSHEESFRHSASLFHSNMIRTKFKNAPEYLVEALGQLNFERHMRLFDARNSEIERSHETPQTAKSTSFHDSGIGDSLPITDTIPSMPALSRAASIAFTLAGHSRTKLPPLPRNTTLGPYPCDFCGATVSYRTRRDWE
jgi:hypothetical protein